MTTTKYIGADVHCTTTELAVDRNGKIIQRFTVPTRIPSLTEAIETVARPRVLVMEEGVMTGWLYRNLNKVVDRIIVCDPRRNHLVARDGDKDDKIDSAKLAALARGKFIREVYHSLDEQRVEFKEWVGLYHDRTREAVRQTNKIYGCARNYGVVVPPAGFDPRRRREWLDDLTLPALAGQLELLWLGLDTVVVQASQALKVIVRFSRKYEIIKYWQELPGVGPIRAATLLAYLDTPWRFRKANRLYKYCGLGLQHSSSGTDRHGRPKQQSIHLAWQVNTRLKNAIFGAVISAIYGDNVFADHYRRLLHEGLTPSNARHTVARKMLRVMWGMWKRGERFDPKLL